MPAQTFKLKMAATLATIPLLAGCGLDRNRPDGSGSIECTEVRIAPEVASRLVKFEAIEGDALKKGQLVASLDATNYELRRDEARAAARLADSNLARTQALFSKNSATEKQLDDAKAMADQAAARLALAAKAVADCSVRSPIEGVVTVKSAEEGEVVAPGSTLCVVSRLDEVWLSIYVPEPSLAKIKIGQTAKVKADGHKEEFVGEVAFISPMAEFSPKNAQTSDERAKLVYRVKIALKNPNGVFKPGMPADAWLEANK